MKYGILEGYHVAGRKAFLLIFCCFVCWGCQSVERSDISLDTDDVIIDISSVESDSISQITLLMHRIEAAVKNEDWPRAWQMLRQLEVQYGNPEFVARLGSKMVFWETAINKGMSRAVEEAMYKTEKVLQLTRSRIEQGDYFFSYLLTKRLAESLEGVVGKDDQIQQVHEQLSFLAERVDPDKIVYFPDYVLYRHPGTEQQWQQAMVPAEDLLSAQSRSDNPRQVVGIRISLEDETAEDTFILKTTNTSVYGIKSHGHNVNIRSGDIFWLSHQRVVPPRSHVRIDVVSRYHTPVRIPLGDFEGNPINVMGEIFLPKLPIHQMGQIEIIIAAEEGIAADNCHVELRVSDAQDITYTCQHIGQGRYRSSYIPAQEYHVAVRDSDMSPIAISPNRVQVKRSEINTQKIDAYKNRTVLIQLWHRLSPVQEQWSEHLTSLSTQGVRNFQIMEFSQIMDTSFGSQHRIQLLGGSFGGFTEGDFSLIFHNVPMGHLLYEKLDDGALTPEMPFPDKWSQESQVRRSVGTSQRPEIPFSEGDVYAVRFPFPHPQMLRHLTTEQIDSLFVEVLIHVKSITTDN